MMSLEQHAKALLSSPDTDPSQFHQDYDQFLWMLCTASREEIRTLAPKLFDDPLIRLPIPLQVVLFRILGLEYLGDEETANMALSGIAMYCDPIEHENAIATIRSGISK